MEKNNRYKHVKWCLEGLKRKSKKYLNANVDANVFFFTQILYETAPGNTIEKFENPNGINSYITQYTQNEHTG